MNATAIQSLTALVVAVGGALGTAYSILRLLRHEKTPADIAHPPPAPPPPPQA